MTLRRDLNPMPDDVRQALEFRSLVDAYEARPPFQRNDYLGWITRARKPETREKRLIQMLDELEDGDIYMKMRWSPAS
ncbi:YdeI/OmpD-associated family protein [Phenylobacterium sp. LjRoot164]|uniref:YdeI/OmpD-associated family protein n=1 Tax=unclassified Phenylobacterium TaxID=2640670 RepID=UPI003ED01987